MPKLFTEKSAKSDSEEELNINKDYAKNYNLWRQKEELNKLKARYGENVSLEDDLEDSSSSSEDDEGDNIPEQFEKNFYKTLACLKNKDPKIYDNEVKFFNDNDNENTKNKDNKKKKSEKSLFLRDYERKIIVERGGKLSDSEDEEEIKKINKYTPTYVEEQNEIKESFKKALHESDDEDLLLQPKKKTEEEAKKEDDDFKEWLKGQEQVIDEEDKKDLKPLRDFWNDPKLDENEKFLRDYILNNKFLDNENEEDLGYDLKAHDSDENLSEDEKNINEQEEFEHKFNFRFEEPDQDFIKRYPRTIENSLRKKDTKRSQKRAEVKARKDKEKLQKQEELKRLKALKRKEIEEKIDKLKEITGNDDIKFNMFNLEDDFDPDDYDKKMNQVFNDEYYSVPEDDQKPEFPDFDEELGAIPNWDNYDPNNKQSLSKFVYEDEPHCEDPDFIMDADYIDTNKQQVENEIIESTKKSKKKKKNKFAELIAKEKPKFDPTQYKSYQEYFDQYYALDYEDMIGDLPCRFKYRKVVPNNFGLSVEEILVADDKELNKWCSLKKALQHRPEHLELNDVKTYKQKASNEMLKRKILPSLYKSQEEEPEDKDNIIEGIQSKQTEESDQQVNKKKRKRKKKNKSANVSLTNNDNSEKSEKKDLQSEINNSTNDPVDKPRKKKRKMDNNSTINNEQEQDNKQSSAPTNNKNKNLDDSKQTNINTEETTAEEPINKKDKKKKQKNKIKKDSDENNLETNIPNESSVKSGNDKTKNDSIDTKIHKEKDKNKKNKKKNNKFTNKGKNNRVEKLKTNDGVASLSEERLKAYGINPKKFKNKLKYMNKR